MSLDLKPYAVFAIAIRPGNHEGDVTTGLTFAWAESIEDAKRAVQIQIERACPRSKGYRRYTVNAQEIPFDMRQPPAQA